MPPPTFTTQVTAAREVAPGVRELTLAPVDPPLAWEPGQWVSLHLPVGEHPPLVRAYSLAAPPSATGELVLCLDRVPGGLGSEYLFGVEPGEPITLAGPLGNFVLPETAADLLWMARYTGIVPFRSMLRRLLAHPQQRRVTLLYSAERPEDLVYLPELAAAASSQPWFELLPICDTPAEGWTGDVGRLPDRLPRWLGERRDLTPMICGKRDFVRPLRDFFYHLGWDRRSVKWENYD